MKIPEYVPKEEVRRACKELGIRDWTKIDPKGPRVTLKEAKAVLKQLKLSKMRVDPEQFRIGLEVELEHGTMFKEYNVTNNHPILTGKVVLAHMMETLDYYMRLEVMELEGDLTKAIADKKPDKAAQYMKRLARAREELSHNDAKRIKGA